MRSIILHSRLIALGVVVFLACTLTLGLAGPQGQDRKSSSEAGTSEPGRKPPPKTRDSLGRQLVENDKVAAAIDKMIAGYDLKPHPLPPIPDNPPPHEGALISLPHLVEPPDLIIVELLEGLPGRPISGERLVRPDGKICLGFYGDLEVRGLTLEQVKVAIIKHLRKYLDDAALGLKLEPDAKAIFAAPAAVDEEGGPFDGRNQLDRRPRGGAPPPAPAEPGYWALVPPAESGAVMVDITSYNSHNYYVEGDAQTVGKMPWTGNETVLDVIEHAGGLLASAEPTDIRLIRPGTNGRPSKVYKVDLEAIRERGDVKSNYQVFAGDRLFVGRNPVVSRTAEIDRLATGLQTVTSWNLQYAFMLRALQFAAGDSRDELLKELVDFWSKELSRGGGAKLDEQKLRDAFIRKLRVSPAPIVPDGR